MSKNDCASMIWTINNFNHLWQKNNEAIVSPIFIIYMPEETKWKLMLFPSGTCDSSCMSFFLYRDKDCSGVEMIEVNYILEILAADGSNLARGLPRKDVFRNNIRHGSDRYISREIIFSNKNKYLPQDILTLRCEMTQFNEKTMEIHQMYARTTIGVEKRCFLWSIDNFSNLTSNQKRSYIFQSAQKVILQIDFHANKDYNAEEKICLGICTFDRCVKFSVFKTFIIDSQKKKVDAGENECWLHYGGIAMFSLNFTTKQLMDNERLYLPNDTLTLSFELTIKLAFEEVEKVNVIIENWGKCIAQEKICDSPCALVSDLESLLKDQSSCDMKLQTKTNVFPVHTLILSARSPVFKAMFSSEMKEKLNGCVDVSDLDAETVRRFLLYLYTDQIEDLKWEDALQMYRTADKYAVISLKEKCSTFLKSNLNLENACEGLILSDLHQDQDFKLTVQNLILGNARIIFKSEEWKLLAATNSKLVIETMLRNWTED